MNAWQPDLVVLVPDKHMESAVDGLLSRPRSLGIRSVSFTIYVHVERDPGCFLHGHDFLRPMAGRFAHALLLFDRHGCGREHEDRTSLEGIVASRLASAGRGDRAAAIVLDPELEVWVWSDSPELDRCLGWGDRRPDLRTWLRDEGLWPADQLKPPDPKAAMRLALHRVRAPVSSSRFGRLARTVSLERCVAPAFTALRDTLRSWFPAPAK